MVCGKISCQLIRTPIRGAGVVGGGDIFSIDMCFLTWSAKAKARDPKSCLGRVFNLKLDSFAVRKEVH